MRKSLNVLLISTALITAIFALGCPKRVSIGEIEANPGKYQDKEVAVAGTVLTSYGVSVPMTGRSGGIYKIDDGTGTIWVITENSVPSKNAQLGVKGKIQNGVNYNGKNYGLVLVEDDRKFKRD